MDLFVDCDDTLFLYHTKQGHTPYGLWKGLPYTPNFRLIGAIVVFRAENPDSKITVWSGGGGDYALECAMKLGIAPVCNRFMVKDLTNFHLIQDGDIIVDDDDLDHIRTHNPHDWPA